MTVNLPPPFEEEGSNTALERALDDRDRKTAAATARGPADGPCGRPNSLIRKAATATTAPTARIRGRLLSGPARDTLRRPWRVLGPGCDRSGRSRTMPADSIVIAGTDANHLVTDATHLFCVSDKSLNSKGPDATDATDAKTKAERSTPASERARADVVTDKLTAARAARASVLQGSAVGHRNVDNTPRRATARSMPTSAVDIRSYTHNNARAIHALTQS